MAHSTAVPGFHYVYLSSEPTSDSHQLLRSDWHHSMNHPVKLSSSHLSGPYHVYRRSLDMPRSFAGRPGPRTIANNTEFTARSDGICRYVRQVTSRQSWGVQARTQCCHNRTNAPVHSGRFNSGHCQMLSVMNATSQTETCFPKILYF